MKESGHVSQKHWSFSIRLLHWVLALAMILSFATHEGGGKFHEITGYIALASAVLRTMLGILGTDRWRFSSFVRNLEATFQYAKQVLRKTEPRYLGHNPLAAWMILALLFVAIMSGLSGWLYTTDQFWGVAWVGDTHDILGHLIIPLLLLHVAGAIFTSLRHRENLVAAMIHGNKRAPDGSDIE
jgi:cytochrome b